MKQKTLSLFIKSLLVIGFLFIFVGCSTDFTQLSLNSEQTEVPAERYLELARGATGNTALEYRLRAAESFIKAKRVEEAGHVFREVQIAEATNNVDLRNKMLEARLALLKEDNTHALSLVQTMLNTLTEGKKEQSAFNPNANVAVDSHNGKKIALLLPTKGPHAEAAKTIREGFFAAFYKAQQQRTSDPSIKVYDTNDGKAVEAAFRQAVADNADMIVGPLTKSEVKTIASLPSTIPVLALNSINDKGSKTLYQFGLMPEDEIVAVAEHAKRQGHKRAIVIAPKNEWGQRMSKAFNQAWVAQGGQIVSTVILKSTDHEEQSAQIQAALQFNKNAVKGKGKNKNNPDEKMVRRQDIDMVFLAAQADLARKIKPLIGFYGSVKLPVYATATVYSGSPTPNKDHDLDGICFCDMPWVLNTTNVAAVSRDSAQSAKKASNSSSNSPRYFALGLDAYQLAQQLSGSSSLSSTSTSYATGDLTLEGQRFQRRLSCAKFSNGVPVPDQ